MVVKRFYELNGLTDASDRDKAIALRDRLDVGLRSTPNQEWGKTRERLESLYEEKHIQKVETA